MWATLTRLLDFQIARASKHASKYHGQKQTETRICTGGRGTMSGTARPAPWLGRPVLSRIGFNSRVVYSVRSHPGWLIQLYPGRDGSRGFFMEAALIVSDRLPNAIDRHVASRLLLRRREAGLTQQMVADALGVTFQQFQKYERAVNRISAGMLYQLSLTLEVPVQYFFEGLSGRRKKPR